MTIDQIPHRPISNLAMTGGMNQNYSMQSQYPQSNISMTIQRN